MLEERIPWPHAPTHQLALTGTFFVTGSTYLKLHHFRGADRLRVLHRGPLKMADKYGWRLEAWAVFSNHYHFVAHSPSDAETAESLCAMLKELHQKAGLWANRLDHAKGRQVWYNYRDTRLTIQRSYLARLHYVQQNPVHHGLVSVANQYPWCSARWFERTTSPAQVRSIYRFKIDRVAVPDDFEPEPDW
jgi:putative transposase